MDPVYAKSLSTIKYLCFDLDGTLVDGKKKLLNYAEEVLQEARALRKTMILLSCNPGVADIAKAIGISLFFDRIIWCNTCKKALQLYIHGIDDRKAVHFDDLPDIVKMFEDRGYLVEKEDIRDAWERFKEDFSLGSGK
jgi:ribonucleotide monophosphatase NagD (HAD superfamily)